MKQSATLIALIILCDIASSQSLGVKAQSDPRQLMYSILREREEGLKMARIEIREYTHPLLKKYLPDYKFYIPYIPPYLSCLGIVDQENRLSLFDNTRWGKQDLAGAFLKTASIKRGVTSRTDNELREIASMFLILSSLKGLNGYGFIEVDPIGLPTVQELKPEDFKLTRGRDVITASYKRDNDKEVLECSLSFDLNGNVTGGKAFYSIKFQSL